MSKQKRYAVSATNPQTGEIWSIHDSKAVCEREVKAKLDEWGTPDAPFDVVDISDEVEDPDEQTAPTHEPPVVAEGDGFSDTVEG